MSEEMIRPTRIFKCLDSGRMAVYGYGQWPEIGEWTEPKEPRMCWSGWHLTYDHHVLEWLNSELYIAEVHPEAKVVTQDVLKFGPQDKFVVSQARLVKRVETWNTRTALRFRAELHKIQKFPSDGWDDFGDWTMRVRDAIGNYTHAYIIASGRSVYGHNNNTLIDEARRTAWAILEPMLFGEVAE